MSHLFSTTDLAIVVTMPNRGSKQPHDTIAKRFAFTEVATKTNFAFGDEKDPGYSTYHVNFNNEGKDSLPPLGGATASSDDTTHYGQSDTLSWCLAHRRRQKHLEQVTHF